jgi:phage recombination protein Bet
MAGSTAGRVPLTSYPNVEVFQHGTSQRHTARCECGWQTSVGSMQAAQTAAKEHRQAGCVYPPDQTPAKTDVVPAAPPAVARPSGPWTSQQMEIVRRSVAPGSTDDELAFFAQVCRHKGLDPFAGEIVAIQRWDKRAGRNVLVIQETVAGLRALAERSGLYNGQDPPLWCGPDGAWREVWLNPKEPPAACKVAVYRKGWDHPTVGIATYASYVQLNRDGKPTGLWDTGPDFMLWKCAEAAALKRAFKHAIAEAGVSTREFSGPQRISMEAREVGLDDDDRHALVAQVTGGRTDSTRDLTDSEALEVRAELARIRAEVGADPETGVIDETSAGPAGDTQSDVAQTPSATGATAPRGASRPPDPADAVTRTIARGAGTLEERLGRLTPWQIEELKTWRRAFGLARPVATLDQAERTRLAAELDHRGWGQIEDPEPDPPPEPDLFGDEPF